MSSPGPIDLIRALSLVTPDPRNHAGLHLAIGNLRTAAETLRDALGPMPDAATTAALAHLTPHPLSRDDGLMILSVSRLAPHLAVLTPQITRLIQG